MADTMTTQTTVERYTACVGYGRERYIELPDDDRTVTLAEARRLLEVLRAQGYREAYILDHCTGQPRR